MEHNEPIGPGDIRFFGRAAVVLAADCQADLVKEFVFFLHGMMCWDGMGAQKGGPWKPKRRHKKRKTQERLV